MTIEQASVGILTGRRVRRMPPALVVASMAFVGLVLVAAFIGETVYGSKASAIDAFNPGTAPSGQHLLGTDELGRDILYRVIVGARTALVGPALIAVSGVLASVGVGVTAGYLGGRFDSIAMRLVDFLLAFPSLLLIIVIVTVTGGGYTVAIGVLIILNAPSDIRIIRGAAISQRSLPYVEALRVTGVPTRRILIVHIARNAVPLLVANFALDFAAALVTLAGLAFLGLGLPPGTADWGQMITAGEAVLFSNPVASLGPAACVVLLAVAVNLVGDWLHARLDTGIGA